MKKAILIITMTLLATFNSYSQEGIDQLGNPQQNFSVNKLKTPNTTLKSGKNSAQIISVIPSPTQGVGDIAFDGKYLWVGGFADSLLFQISPTDGSIIDSIPTNVQRPYGLTFDGSDLWLADADSNMIQQIDTSNGNVIQSFQTPLQNTNSHPSGLAWDDSTIWHNEGSGLGCTGLGDSTFQINKSGQILQSHDAVSGCSIGLAFDGKYLWSSDNHLDELYKIDTSTFLVVDTIKAPGGDYPNGLASDGKYLWVANNDTDSIYQIDIGIIPTSIKNLNKTKLELTIYPNPSSDKLTIISNQLSIFSISIISIEGKLIKSFQHNTSTINIADLHNGIYFIQLLNDDMRINKKFVKQ